MHLSSFDEEGPSRLPVSMGPESASREDIRNIVAAVLTQVREQKALLIRREPLAVRALSFPEGWGHSLAIVSDIFSSVFPSRETNRALELVNKDSLTCEEFTELTRLVPYLLHIKFEAYNTHYYQFAARALSLYRLGTSMTLIQYQELLHLRHLLPSEIQADFPLLERHFTGLSSEMTTVIDRLEAYQDNPKALLHILQNDPVLKKLCTDDTQLREIMDSLRQHLAAAASKHHLATLETSGVTTFVSHELSHVSPTDADQYIEEVLYPTIEEQLSSNNMEYERFLIFVIANRYYKTFNKLKLIKFDFAMKLAVQRADAEFLLKIYPHSAQPTVKDKIREGYLRVMSGAIFLEKKAIEELECSRFSTTARELIRQLREMGHCSMSVVPAQVAHALEQLIFPYSLIADTAVDLSTRSSLASHYLHRCLHAIKKGEEGIYPLRSREGEVGHALLLCYRREEDGSITLQLFNAGAGRDHHVKESEEERYYPYTIHVTDPCVMTESVCRDLILCCTHETSKIYEILSGLGDVLNREALSASCARAYRPQIIGNCAVKSLLVWMRERMPESLYLQCKISYQESFIKMMEEMVAKEREEAPEATDLQLYERIISKNDLGISPDEFSTLFKVAISETAYSAAKMSDFAGASLASQLRYVARHPKDHKALAALQERIKTASDLSADEIFEGMKMLSRFDRLDLMHLIVQCPTFQAIPVEEIEAAAHKSLRNNFPLNCLSILLCHRAYRESGYHLDDNDQFKRVVKDLLPNIVTFADKEVVEALREVVMRKSIHIHSTDFLFIIHVAIQRADPDMIDLCLSFPAYANSHPEDIAWLREKLQNPARAFFDAALARRAS